MPCLASRPHPFPCSAVSAERRHFLGAPASRRPFGVRCWMFPFFLASRPLKTKIPPARASGWFPGSSRPHLCCSGASMSAAKFLTSVGSDNRDDQNQTRTAPPEPAHNTPADNTPGRARNTRAAAHTPAREPRPPEPAARTLRAVPGHKSEPAPQPPARESLSKPPHPLAPWKFPPPRLPLLPKLKASFSYLPSILAHFYALSSPTRQFDFYSMRGKSSLGALTEKM